jgi:hypothetical protein
MRLAILCFVVMCFLLMILCLLLCIMLHLTFCRNLVKLGGSRRWLQYKKGGWLQYKKGGWWGHWHDGHTHTHTHVVLCSQLICHVQFGISLHPARLWRYLHHTTSKLGVSGCVGRGQWRRGFGSCPTSRPFVDHAVWPWKGAASPSFGPTLPYIKSGSWPMLWVPPCAPSTLGRPPSH